MDPRYRKRMNRYWDKMRKRAVDSFSDLDPDGWFDHWHCHSDWEGKGDKRPENREASIVLGYEMLQMAERFASSVSIPIQYWWFVNEKSYDDAVYLHSPNVNGTSFPHVFEDVTWGVTGNQVLNSLVDVHKFKTGVIANEYGTIYVVLPVDDGQDLLRIFPSLPQR
jgi:hypothetical protein